MEGASIDLYTYGMHTDGNDSWRYSTSLTHPIFSPLVGACPPLAKICRTQRCGGFRRLECETSSSLEESKRITLLLVSRSVEAY